MNTGELLQDDGAAVAAEGVEWAAVRLMLAARIVNAIQLVVALPATLHLATRPVLDLAVAVIFMSVAAASVLAAIRAGRIVRSWIIAEVAVGVLVLAVTPLFVRADQLVTWPGWTFPMTLLTASIAGTVFSLKGTVAAAAVLSAGHVSWAAHGLPTADLITVATNALAYFAFGVVVFFFMRYLRHLAALVDRRGGAIRVLEQERTRRVLHTPYRLLKDLADMLRAEAAGAADNPGRRARLAEAVSSVAEIEALVRGTTPTTGNLATELAHLREQFADLPLLLNLDELYIELPPRSVYNVREAVRSALQNVRTHANAKQVIVHGFSDNQGWCVSVHDDGDGFASSRARKLGLQGLVVDAIQEIGASVKIHSAPGQGTMIEIEGSA